MRHATDFTPTPINTPVPGSNGDPTPAPRRTSQRAPRKPRPVAALAITPDVEEAIEAAVAAANARPRERRDGWTGERQREFLEAIAQGDPIVYACYRVEMSRASAYAFRTRPHGAAFALAWDAAANIARFSFADYLMQRVIEGVEVETNTMDGKLTIRRTYDHRLAIALLKRMDRLADRAEQRAEQRAEAAREAGRAAPQPAAALVEQHWGGFLDMIEQADADDRDSDAVMVADFIEEHAAADENSSACQICPLHTDTEDDDYAKAVELDDFAEMVDDTVHEAEDGTLTTCLPSENPEEICVPGQWRACTPAETALYRDWQAATDRLDQREDTDRRTAFFANLKAMTDAVSGWAATDGEDEREEGEGQEG